MKIVLKCDLGKGLIIIARVKKEHGLRICAEKPFALDLILQVVSEVTDIPVRHIISSVRDTKLVDARKIFSSLADIYTKESLKTIGKKINISHATVIYHIRRSKEHYAREPKFRETYDRAVRILGGNKAI